MHGSPQQNHQHQQQQNHQQQQQNQQQKQVSRPPMEEVHTQVNF